MDMGMLMTTTRGMTTIMRSPRSTIMLTAMIVNPMDTMMVTLMTRSMTMVMVMLMRNLPTKMKEATASIPRMAMATMLMPVVHTR